MDEVVSGRMPPAGKGVENLFSWQGSHFWVCIIICKVRQSDSVAKPNQLYYLFILSQLYGSTTVVMATHGLHWKWQSLTPCQRHPSEPIEKIFGTIDYVIDLNNQAKFGFGKIFPDGDTHTQHIRVRPFFFFFFFNFLRSLMRVQPKRLNRFWRAIRHSTPFGGESDPFLEMKNIGQWPWPWKGQNPPFCLTRKILTRIFSKTVRDREKMSIEVRYEVMYGLSNGENIFDPRWPPKVKGQGQTLKNF